MGQGTSKYRKIMRTPQTGENAGKQKKSQLKIKVALLYIAQLLQLLSLMSLQFLHPFRQLDRRAID